MDKDKSDQFLLSSSDVDEINALLAKYYECLGCHKSGRYVAVYGGCDGCSRCMTHDETDAACELVEAFEECMKFGFLTGGKKARMVCMDDVPREVWDNTYDKWSKLLRVGWTPSAWNGCSLCAWMANMLGVDRMRDVRCEMCPIYEDEWCMSMPGESKIHPYYTVDGEYPDEPWADRVNEFLAFIKPYCSRDCEDKLRDDVLRYVTVNSGSYDVTGITRCFDSRYRDDIYSILDGLIKDGLIERCRDEGGIYSLCVVSNVMT